MKGGATERQILSSFFRWLIQEKVLATNPALLVPKQKIVRSKIPKCLDPEHEEPALLVGNAGIRVRELANLTKVDINLRTELLHVTAKPDWTPKDYEERSIHLNRRARAAVRRD